ASSMVTGVTSADPVLWTIESGGNGHYYEIIIDTVFWTDALTGAASRILEVKNGDLRGYLATVTSSAEDEFLYDMIAVAGFPNTWLGGSDSGDEGSFTWRAGPESGNPFTYTNWTLSQPDNSHGDEHYLMMVGQDGSFGFQGGEWNDARLDPEGSILEFRPTAYAVEYSLDFPVSIEMTTWGAIKSLYTCDR
ncbi:MAG: hypothetical protein KJ749_09065, partial [Planctomycetes bacterium]|nr:hypothetical protein [Planctomycetota bacterium]